MTDLCQTGLVKLGFRFGANGPHAARTMMLEDLRVLFDNTHPQSSHEEYAIAVIDRNVLGKPTRKARELAFRHITALYSLELMNPIFRALRRLWTLNQAAQPMLALAVALARDPLLRSTQSYVLTVSQGAPMPRINMESFLNTSYPNRFSPASLKSFAQNVAGTWTAAGLLQGRSRKFRSTPAIHPESVAMLLFISFLEGRTGQRLFSSDWLNLFCVSQDELEIMVNTASHRGLLVYMNAGGVKELRFPGYLTSDEEQIRQEVSNVI